VSQRAAPAGRRLFGNLFARVAYQVNKPAEELTDEVRDFVVPGHPPLTRVRAVKPYGCETPQPKHQTPWVPSVEPAQRNPVTRLHAL
jgi:hypothetical protein